MSYVAAMPIAVAATSLLSPALAGQSDAPSYAPWARNSVLFFGIFLVTGVLLGALLRMAVNETVGTRISIRTAWPARHWALSASVLSPW